MAACGITAEALPVSIIEHPQHIVHTSRPDLAQRPVAGTSSRRKMRGEEYDGLDMTGRQDTGSAKTLPKGVSA